MVRNLVFSNVRNPKRSLTFQIRTVSMVILERMFLVRKQLMFTKWQR